MTKVGVVVLSFSLRDQEPNPCNMRLAQEAVRICHELQDEGDEPILGVQWEIELGLKRLGSFRDGQFVSQSDNAWRLITYAGSVGQLEDGAYLGTNEVLEAATDQLRPLGCERLVVVANPFIHQPYSYWLARKLGSWKLMWRHVRWIGFDKQSTQWWCRSWYQLLYQSVRLALGIEHGYGGRQEVKS